MSSLKNKPENKDADEIDLSRYMVNLSIIVN